MKTFAIFLFVLTTISLNAQFESNWRHVGASGFENVWLGGTPGQETNWDNPRNWSENRVPDEDSWVIVQNLNTGHHAFPIINSEVIISGIEVHAGASLKVAAAGELIIDGEYANNYGILNYGDVINEGRISIFNTALCPVLDERNKIQNLGAVALLDDTKDAECLVTKE
jgi:hypothetical protein